LKFAPFTARCVEHTDEIAEWPCPAKIPPLCRPRRFDAILLLYPGGIPIHAQPPGESISQQYQFEREGPAKEAMPAQRAAADQDRRSNPADPSTAARRGRAFYFQATQLRLLAEDYLAGIADFPEVKHAFVVRCGLCSNSPAVLRRIE
jgi:hypothetical protein